MPAGWTMSVDVAPAGASMLSSRAEIARLKLQLRTAIHDAEHAEADLAAAGGSDEHDALRRKIAELMQQGRAGFDEALADARSHATAAIEAAHREASKLADTRAAEATVPHPSKPEPFASLAASTVPPARSPRAAVALLALQLRAAVEEADAAEADEANAVLNAPVAREQVLERLDRLMAGRRAALEAEVAQARADAEAAVSTARREADHARATASLPQPSAVSLSLALRLPPPTLDSERELRPEAESLSVSDERADESAERPLPLPPEVPPGVAMVTVPSNHVLVDADTLARVFASVLGTMLDERLPAWSAGMAVHPMHGLHQAEQPARKVSFWSHLKHPDVLLLGLAMVISIVVLVAWMA